MLPDLLKKGEGERIEYKRSLGEIKEILETIVAFANTNGGWIVVGVDDDGRVVGVKIGKGTLENLVNTIIQSTDPPIYPSISIEEKDQRKVIIITVPAGEDKPYFYKGRAYVRVGRINKSISRSELEAMFARKFYIARSYDSTLVEASLNEIDEKLIKQFIMEAKDKRRLDITYTNISDVLMRLGLLINGKITLAGVLLFGKSPQRHFPYAIIRAGRFKGDILIDDKVIEGPITKQIEEALLFIKRHINVSYTITSEGKREEIWEYPIYALREAIVNAVTHRDYSIFSPVYLRIFDDRIEIENPGRLPEPLTVDDLKREHPSILRNPKIGRIMFFLGYIEQWGTGTNKMIEACIKAGLPEPEFHETKISFKVILKKRSETALNERQRKLIEILKNGKEITRKEYQELFKISERTARKDLEELKKLGLIIAEKRGKIVIYKLAER